MEFEVRQTTKTEALYHSPADLECMSVEIPSHKLPTLQNTVPAMSAMGLWLFGLYEQKVGVDDWMITRTPVVTKNIYL